MPPTPRLRSRRDQEALKSAYETVDNLRLRAEATHDQKLRRAYYEALAELDHITEGRREVELPGGERRSVKTLGAITSELDRLALSLQSAENAADLREVPLGSAALAASEFALPVEAVTEETPPEGRVALDAIAWLTPRDEDCLACPQPPDPSSIPDEF